MEIFNMVTTVLSDLSGKEFISPENELQKDLGLDSLQMVTLLILLEENFQIILNESDMNPFDLRKVKNIIDLVEKYMSGESDGKIEKGN